MSNNWLDEAVARQKKYDEGYESGYQMGKRVAAELIFKDICRLGGCSQGITLNVWDIQELKEKWGIK